MADVSGKGLGSATSPSYDIVPGERAGIFQLGDTLWQVLEHLRVDKLSYPKVEVSWDESHSHTSAVVIHLPHLTLYFPPSATQVLARIVLSDLQGVHIRYETHVLSSPGRPGITLRRGLVGKVLGPTYESGSAGDLVYPGVSFQLRCQALDAGAQADSANPAGIGGVGRDEVVERIVLVPKGGDEAVRVRGVMRCELRPGKGASVVLGSAIPVEIVIGETTHQDLLLDLGPPIRRFWKEDDRMEKMWGGEGGGSRSEGSSDQPTNSGGDCTLAPSSFVPSAEQDFLNYFQYGLDFLVSSSGILLKVIAYSNILGTPLFQRYARCPWTIATPHGPLSCSSPLALFTTAFPTSAGPDQDDGGGSNLMPPRHLDIPQTARMRSGKSTSSDRKKRTGSNTSSRSATSPVPETSVDNGDKKGETGQDGLSRAMVLDRTGEGGLDGVLGDMTSRLVGFEGMVVEVDVASGGISSVLIFRDDP